MSPTRRETLKDAWTVGTGLLAGAAAWTTFEALAPLANLDGTGKLSLRPEDSYEEGSATFVREGHLYVTRAKGQLFAISQKCPHLGCRVPFCAGSGRFECPCHGSIYNVAGEYVSGPAPRGMDRYPITIEEGRVIVNLAEFVEGPPIGYRKFDTPGLNGSCASESAT
jgi:nitrite reductase/ring-hydroxylating ferredoxin subunit